MAEAQKNQIRRRPGGGHHGMTIEKPRDTRKAYHRLIRYIRPYLLPLFFGSVFLIAGVILNVSAPALLGKAVTDYLETQVDIPMFTQRMLLLLAVYVSMFLSNAISAVIIAHVSNRLIYQMRKEGFEKLQDLSISYIDSVGLGDVISRMTNDIETIYNAFSNGFSSVLSGTLSLVGTLIAMLTLSLPLSLAVLAVVPAAVLFIVALGKRIRSKALKNQQEVGSLSATIEESISGMKIIQTFNKQKDALEQFEKVNRSARDAAIDFFTESYKMMPVMTLSSGVSLACVIAIGGPLVILRPEVYSIGLISAFILYSRQFFEPVRQLSNIYNMVQSALAGAERFFQVIDADQKIEEMEESLALTAPKGDVQFDQVSFSYDKHSQVLDRMSFEASSGQVIAIVGPTGAGKTTIINLLSRFYDVDEGAIRIDGKDIRSYRLKDLRSCMGVVLQEPFFFATTIRENLLYGNLEATEEQLIEASRLAGAHHFITCLPDGYDTLLTERGMNLSQGQRQLLAIARTILADPKILILDEATSSIDSLTESKIQDAMVELMKGKTSFIIAHRLSTIKHADKLLVIHDHRIIEEGTHEQLMAAGGFYHRLYALQFEKAQIDEQMIL